MNWTLVVLVGFVIGGQQLGLRTPLWVRLALVTIVIVVEEFMVRASVDGFWGVLLLNWCYVIGVPIGLLFRSWKKGEKFLSHRHADWLVLAAASLVMNSLYRHPVA